MTKSRLKLKFTVNNKNRKALFFVDKNDNRDFIVYNTKNKIAVLSKEHGTVAALDMDTLKKVDKQAIYKKCDSLLNNGYSVYATFKYKDCKRVEMDYVQMWNIMLDLCDNVDMVTY